VDFIAPADYSKGSKLEEFLTVTLKTIIQEMRYTQTQRDMLRYYMKGRRP
jgi:hypothetical protein